MTRSSSWVAAVAAVLFANSGHVALGQVQSFWVGQEDVSAPDATEVKIIQQVPLNGYILTDIVISVRGDSNMHHLIRLSERENDAAPFVNKFAGRFIDNGLQNPDRKLEYHFSSGITLTPNKQVWLWNVPLLAEVTISGYVPQPNQKHASLSDVSPGTFAVASISVLGVSCALASRRVRPGRVMLS